MENASKALLMAAGVLIALIVIGAFMLMFNGLSDYQNKSDVSVEAQQLAAFNNQYHTYDRTGLRGTDMITLMNKVLDYNARKTTLASEEGFREMKLTIKISTDIREQMKYNLSGNNLLITSNTYTQENIGNILDKTQEIENEYQKKYIEGLVSNISNFIDIYSDSSLTTNQKITEIDREHWLPVSIRNYRNGKLEDIYNDLLVYYEYAQLKKTYFDTDGNTKYDSNTGRIISMSFTATKIGD